MHDPAVPIENRYQAKDLTIRNNLIYNTAGFAALEAGGWVNYNIYNNTIFNHTDFAIFYLHSAKWEFFDPTAIDYCNSHSCEPCTSYSGSLKCVNISLPAKNGKIKNNIIYNFDRPFLADPGNTANLQMSHNLYFRQGFTTNTPAAYGINGRWYTLTGFQALGYEANSLIGDPKFISPFDTARLNFKIDKSSPAVDKGISLLEVPQDFEGISRPQGSTFDIGAYEFVSDAPATPIPTSTSTPVPLTVTPTPFHTSTPTQTPTSVLPTATLTTVIPTTTDVPPAD